MEGDFRQIKFNEKADLILTDFSVLISSPRQYEAICEIAKQVSDKVGLPQLVLIHIVSKILTKNQIDTSQFHFEIENVLPQAKIALKKYQSEELKLELYAILADKEDRKVIDSVIDGMMDWYIYTYLAKKELSN